MAPPQPHPLPSPSPSFIARKGNILSALDVPDADYTDLSPKGSVDVNIRPLIAEVNAVDGLVTTSSCAGRISVFLEGVKREDGGRDGQMATPGGKGAGGAWLFVSHDPVSDGAEEGQKWAGAFGLHEVPSEDERSESRRLIHFKFEPMILHVYAASSQHAQKILSCALAAGFRESGALNITPSYPSSGAVTADPKETHPMVGIRSMGLGFESLIGIQTGPKREMLVSDEYLVQLARIGNERFVENQKRIERFRGNLARAFGGNAKVGDNGEKWEDANARRERKRAEGLRRKAEKQNDVRAESGVVEEEVEIPW